MAREWLLRGVDPEELKPTPKDEGPQTPRSRWENFWYHHKLKFWLILFAVVVLVVAVVQMSNRDDPDYRILLLTEEYYSEQELAALEALLTPYGEDIDGDGKVEVRVENSLYGAHVEQTKNSGIQTVQAHLVAADRMFFIMEPDCYNYFLRTLQNTADGGEVTFFAPIDGDDTVWDWKGDPRPAEELREQAESLYFGVRATKGTAGKATELYEQSRQLLENFINGGKKGETIPTPSATVTGDEMIGTTTKNDDSLNGTETTTQGGSASTTTEKPSSQKKTTLTTTTKKTTAPTSATTKKKTTTTKQKQTVVQAADPETGISWDGKSPIVYTYEDGSTGTVPKDGATYEFVPGVQCIYSAPAEDVYDGKCSRCGKIEGDGRNGTCVRWLMGDVECPNCGEYVEVHTCHTCDE